MFLVWLETEKNTFHKAILAQKLNLFLINYMMLILQIDGYEWLKQQKKEEKK